MGVSLRHHLRSANGKWRQFSKFGDGIKQAVFGTQDDLLVVTLRERREGELFVFPLQLLMFRTLLQ